LFEAGRYKIVRNEVAKVTAYIIAFNEAGKIEEALQSVAWADEIIVADSHSTDRTAEIARRYTDRVIQIDFHGFGKLRNDAITHATHQWIFSLDADERCTPEVRDEIRKIINTADAADAYLVPRRNLFMGRWIRFSGWYPNYRQPQLFRNGKMHYTEDQVHEGYVLDGKLGRFRNAIWQIPFRDLSQMMQKMDRYSTLGAQKLQEKNRRGSMLVAFLHGLWAFVRMYIIRLGFFDGWPGFVIALSTFEGTFYRYAKLTEAQRGWNRGDRVEPAKMEEKR
jgi:glycosyltransferase involved in cell wall biosynthesis